VAALENSNLSGHRDAQNGVMDPRMLFEHPFTNISSEGPSGLFKEEDATKIVVKIIRSMNVKRRQWLEP
jgi:hypothetical protein